uniref:Uncharacterized protein n=1 Tax=Anopheles maculatus TaxID=74869 RepID=A0A182S9C7_9DIPT
MRKISVRHLVSKIENRAAETLERNFGGRFSGRLRKEKRQDESGAGASASSAEAPTTSAARSWYMVHLSPDKRSNLPSSDTASAVSLSSSVATDEDDHHENGGDVDVQQGVIGRDKISADSAEFSQR